MAGEMVYEEIPSFRRRDGDVVLAGRNNACIIIGRDRTTGVGSGFGADPAAGAILLVVGRSTDDLSLVDDRASVYVSMKSDPDDTLGLGSSGPSSAVVLRADRIRIVPRDDLVISVGGARLVIGSNGMMTLDGDIRLGREATERLIKGESFASAFSTHQHLAPAGGGPTGGPLLPLPESIYSRSTRTS